MIFIRPRCFMLALLLTLAGAAHAGDTFRCGSKLVTTGLTQEEVLARCGEPAKRATEEVPVWVRNANGSTRQNGTTKVERWTYDRGNTQFPAVLEFQEGKLKSIELQRP